MSTGGWDPQPLKFPQARPQICAVTNLPARAEIWSGEPPWVLKFPAGEVIQNKKRLPKEPDLR